MKIHSSRLVAAVLVATIIAACSSDNVVAGNSTAIKAAQRVSGVSAIVQSHPDYDWQVIMWCTADGKCPRPGRNDAASKYPVRVVCYCKTASDSPLGWYIEVNLQTHSARAISGNAGLEKRYGLDSPASSR